tara:strand:- start:325 stop:453 length:129 start_codon:yes stop_codon:yes gene_type:complete
MVLRFGRFISFLYVTAKTVFKPPGAARLRTGGSSFVAAEARG